MLIKMYVKTPFAYIFRLKLFLQRQIYKMGDNKKEQNHPFKNKVLEISGHLGLERVDVLKLIAKKAGFTYLKVKRVYYGYQENFKSSDLQKIADIITIESGSPCDINDILKTKASGRKELMLKHNLVN